MTREQLKKGSELEHHISYVKDAIDSIKRTSRVIELEERCYLGDVLEIRVHNEKCLIDRNDIIEFLKLQQIKQEKEFEKLQEEFNNL